MQLSAKSIAMLKAVVFLAANSTQNLGNVPRVRLSGFELDANIEAADVLIRRAHGEGASFITLLCKFKYVIRDA